MMSNARRILYLLLLSIAFASAAQPGHAESPPPFKDFSAKRVKAPKPGASPKIDVQIGQTSPENDAKPTSANAPTIGGAQKYAWFWEAISPEMEVEEPNRFERALQRVTQPPGGTELNVMRLQELQEIAAKFQTEILTATVGTMVSPALVLAVIAVESSGVEAAESAAGARGLMQLMPATVERFGVSDPLVAADNIQGGVAFLDLLMAAFDRDPLLVLAGYNAGENAVREAGGVPDYPETRDYVPKVLATYALARGLCRTPPELITDGCVFVGR